MKTKLLITTIIAGLLIPATAATAQTSTAELRRDRQDIRSETRDVRQAQRNGTHAQVRDEREDLREARREYREDRADRRDDRRDARRDDRRDDRADHRRHNNRFDAPFRYHRFANGNRIANSYWAPRYQINDVRRYRLPMATRQQAYVRHYDDLLLVNTRNGTVIRVWRNMY